LRRGTATGAHPRQSEALTDGELVTLAQNGVEPAFSHLLERQTRHVQRLVGRRLRDPDEIRDVIQDTHLAVWRALHHYDARRPFEAWVTSIALNKCRDRARRGATRIGALQPFQANAADIADAEERGPEQRLIGEETLRRLAQALDRLPPPLRAPLVLTVLLERSQAAAARELGLTRKAVEMRVRRARQHLAQSLHMGCAAS
jgi:RNA polymerase sigma-70 factor (ECF subfamily)